MKASAENTTERPPNDPWFMSCQTQDPEPSLTITWSAQLPAPPRPFFILNHQIKKMNLPPIQKRYVRGMTKGTFPPCKLNMLEQPQQIYNMVNQEPNGNTWIWPTKTSKTTQQIIANLIGTATIATIPLKSFAQWYGLKSKESLRLWPLTVAMKRTVATVATHVSTLFLISVPAHLMRKNKRQQHENQIPKLDQWLRPLKQRNLCIFRGFSCEALTNLTVWFAEVTAIHRSNDPRFRWSIRYEASLRTNWKGMSGVGKL